MKQEEWAARRDSIVAEWVVYLHGRPGVLVALDLNMMRAATGLPLDQAFSDEAAELCGTDGYFLPLVRAGKSGTNVTCELQLICWLRLERRGLNEAQYQWLSGGTASIMHNALHQARRMRQVLGAQAIRKRWVEERITPESIKALYDALKAGATLNAAARQLGIANSTAQRIWDRSGTWTRTNVTAWFETFGGPDAPDSARVKADKRAAARLDAAAALVYGTPPMPMVEAAAQLGVSRQRLRNWLTRDPSHLGPRSADAWRRAQRLKNPI